MPRPSLAIALALLLSPPLFAQAPAADRHAKPAAVAAAVNAPPAPPASRLEPHAPPGAQRTQDELYRRSPAAARLAEPPSTSGLDLASPQPLLKWSESDPQRSRQDSENRRTRCAHSIKQMRESGNQRSEGRARRDCAGVGFGD